MQYRKKMHGSSFVPTNDLSLAPAPNQMPFGQTATETQRRVMVLSHDAEACFMYRTILEIWSYRVEEFHALDEAITEDRQPDLILMDGILQFEKNLEEIRRIREDISFCDTPVVLISGFAQEKFRILALANGADDFLVKPLDFELLKHSLKNNIQKSADGLSNPRKIKSRPTSPKRYRKIV